MLSLSTASEPGKPKTVTAPLWFSGQLPAAQKGDGPQTDNRGQCCQLFAERFGQSRRKISPMKK
jgi:hypothetical protein